MDVSKLSQMVTEGRNPDTMDIDKLDTVGIIALINEEDKKVACAVEGVKEDIARAVDVISDRLSRGGRLIYIGAGTSGRLGIVDASECPPTFGVDFEMVQGVIAGGKGAIFKSVEGAEDSWELGKKDLIEEKLAPGDVVCGIAASGRTPYTIGGMKYAKEIGAAVVCITMNPESEMAKIADYPISVIVGPEVIMGSTRMKAGTAQKMVLNMLTTATMIKLGKVYSNLMVDVKASNEKLLARAKRIVMMAADVEEDIARAALEESNYDVKLAIFILKTGLGKDDAKKVLDQHKGYIQKAIDYVETNG
jgi:N-acetylmuramic acid 6-phosphate etherase